MIERLPDDATWEDVQYSIYVRERIERGRGEAADGKILDEDEVERRMKPGQHVQNPATEIEG